MHQVTRKHFRNPGRHWSHAPQSDKSSPEVHHAPKHSRLRGDCNKSFDECIEFPTVPHNIESSSFLEVGPDSLTSVGDATQHMKDKVVYWLNDKPWMRPWTQPETSQGPALYPYVSEESQEHIDGTSGVPNYDAWYDALDSAYYVRKSKFYLDRLDRLFAMLYDETAGVLSSARRDAKDPWSSISITYYRHGKQNLLQRVHQFRFPCRETPCIRKGRTRQRLIASSDAIAQQDRLNFVDIKDLPVKRVRADFSISFLLKSANEHLKGRKALVAWKEGAGLSKPWRRCNRVTMSDSRIRVILRCSDQSFYNSPLWLPQAFIRSPTRQRHNDRKRTLVSVKRARRLNKYFEPLLLRVEEDKQGCESYQSQRSLTRIQERIPADLGNAELPAAYMRLLWGSGSTLNGQLDRFLPEGLILQSHWCVSSFLRNDSHADVYAVTDIHHQHGPSPELELHSFLTDLSGNSVTYAKRKQERVYKSDHCLGRFWYGERRMLVIRLPKPVTQYRLQMEDFPKLKGIISRTRTQFRHPHRLSSIPTYAEVLGTTNHDPQSPPLSQQIKEEEARIFEQINEKVREKKSKKQRDKRRSERLVRRLAQQTPA